MTGIPKRLCAGCAGKAGDAYNLTYLGLNSQQGPCALCGQTCFGSTYFVEKKNPAAFKQ